MRIKRGPILMLLGTALVLGAVGLSAANNWTASKSDAATAEVCRILEEQVIAPVEQANGAPAREEDLPARMQSVKIDDKAYIGVLELSALGVTLPVQSDWSEQLLQTAPCRYAGSLLEGGLVVAGHNYRKQFGHLGLLRPGDSVQFTDVDGNHIFFEVNSVETLDGSDVEGMLDGNWDLTLFTCTLNGRSRVTVRCIRAEPAIELAVHVTE